MRYPDGSSRRSNSINITGDSGLGSSGTSLPLRFPSSSSTSQESQNSLPEHEDENDLPGRTPAGTGTAAGGRANIETISEHVLFGNNNGHNSFLYLYYSSSSSHHRNNHKTPNANNIIKRPYTTSGGIKGGTIMGSREEEGSQQSGMSQWNDFSGGRGSAGPSPLSYNNNEENDEEGYFGFDEGSGGKRGKVKEDGISSSKSSNRDTNGNAKNLNDIDFTVPYPVYLSPVEGSPIRLPSISPKQKSGEEEEEDDEDEDTRTSSRITGGPRQDRLDSFGADLLEDDWDKIYSVPDVDARYIMSPDTPSKVGTKRKENENDGSDLISSSSTHHHHHHHHQHSHHKKQPRSINKQQSTTSSNSLSVSKSNFHSSANSLSKGNKQGSIKRVRVTPDEGRRGGHHGGSSMKQWSSTSSNKLTPSSGLSRTPSTKSLKRGNSTRHGVTHHHHQPLSGVSIDGDENDNGGDGPHAMAGGKRVSSTTTGDGFDQMSFQFRNGIGAFFGTPASRQISQKHEPTPEEMYKEEMQGWKPRLATGATIFTATLLILSCASLLFVFPILVDPILVGFEAEFSSQPVTCRTTNYRNGSGPSECAIPSCREGCTLDLFNCIFVDVEYYPLSDGMNDNLLLEPRNNTSSSILPARIDNTSIPTNIISTTTPTPSFETTNSNNITTLTTSRQKRSAILLININGCGYPPHVTCSDFEKKYAPLNTQFPCYYSQSNESIVVPDYSRRTETIHLILAICVPFGTILVSGISLYLLVRYMKYLKWSIYRKFAQRKNAIRAKRIEDREKAAKKAKDEEEDNATDISELEPQEEYNYRKNIKALQNGTSKTGAETSLMLNNTEM